MRISTWLRLIALGLIAGSLPASPLAARSPNPGATKVVIHDEFTGYGKTEKIAQKDALERACNWLKESSGLDWIPDPDYLLLYKMVQFGDAEERKFDDPVGDMKVVKLRLEIQEYQVLHIQKQVQQQRMKERQKPTLLALLGAMGLLGVVGGYLRLEEATKGYYTRLLRMAAISALVVIVAGLCVAG